jgi:hypothetical protein
VNKLMLGMSMQALITSLVMCAGMRVSWVQQLVVATFSLTAAAWAGE